MDTTEKVIDESQEAANIFDEFKRRFAETIEKEKERLREQSKQQSADIIAEAEEKARQILEKALKRAEKESAAIVTVAEQKAQQTAQGIIGEAEEESTRILEESRGLVKQIIGEVNQCAKAVAELKQEIEQYIETAREKIQREADMVTKALQEAEKTTTEARDKIRDELGERVGLIAELKQKLKQVAEDIENAKVNEPRPPGKPGAAESLPTPERKEVIQPGIIAVGDFTPHRAHEDSLFTGTLELDVTPPGDSARLKTLVKRLSQIPGAQVLQVDCSQDSETKVHVFIAKALSMLSILKEMATVKDVVGRGNTIRVVLDTNDPWVG